MSSLRVSGASATYRPGSATVSRKRSVPQRQKEGKEKDGELGVKVIKPI